MRVRDDAAVERDDLGVREGPVRVGREEPGGKVGLRGIHRAAPG